MEYLQYLKAMWFTGLNKVEGFKPCYKWNTFNTKYDCVEKSEYYNAF